MIIPTKTRTLLCGILFGLMIGPLGAELPRTTELSQDYYSYLTMWYEAGYIDYLPSLRPYPSQFIISALDQVIHAAPARDAARARRFRELLDTDLQLGFRNFHESRVSGNDYFGFSGQEIESTGFLLPQLSIAGNIGLTIVDTGKENLGMYDAFPEGYRRARDFAADDSRVSAAGRDILVTAGMNGIFAAGSDTTWFQAGLTRSSFGPFWDSGPVFSPQTPHHGHYSFTLRKDKFAYTHVLFGLTATKDDGTARAIARDGDSVYPEKFLALHELSFFPLSWLQFSIFESITYGQRFEPVYMLPTSVLFYNQLITGEKDSAFIGAQGTLRLPHAVAMHGQVYIGDLHFTDMISGNFDTRYKAAAQAGTNWNPLGPILERVSVEYGFVLPYTYTHRRKPQADVVYDNDIEPKVPTINYQNYTHGGQSLVDMEPNSDRLRLGVRLRPHNALTLGLRGAFLRHANATPEGAYDENNTYVGTTDGSVTDPGYRGGPNLYDSLNFLTQDVVEQIVQLGVDADVLLPTPLSSFRRTAAQPVTVRLNLGYTFEYGWNRRPSGAGERVEVVGGPGDPHRAFNRPVPKKGNNGATHFLQLGFSISY